MILAVMGRKHRYKMYWLPSVGKTIVTHSLPNLGDECQQIINDFWPCILRTVTSHWLQRSINDVLATFSDKNNRDTILAPS